MQQSYGVSLSPDASLSGPVGGQVVHTVTITNTGDVTDTIDLSAAGQTWAAALSTLAVNLTPSASATFTVAVTIPPGATDHESDTVTITAVSQGDNSKTDSSVLATIAVKAPAYGVSLSPDASLSGPVGGQVVHTVTITNTGSVVDTFDLVCTGHSWMTTPSVQAVTLAAGSSQRVPVTISIPPEANANTTDQVSVQATSQHDTSKHAVAVLTTVALGESTDVYMPVIMFHKRQ